MKGLLVKEIYILKKEFLFVLIFLTVLIVAMITLGSAHDSAEGGQLIGSMNGLYAAVSALSIGMLTSSFKYDSKCGHTQYSLITPVSRKDYVWSKMIILAAASVFSGIWLYAVSFVSCAVSGITVTGTEAAKAAFVTLVMVIVSLQGGIMSIYYHLKKGEDKWAFPWFIAFFIEITVFLGFILRYSSGRSVGFVIPVIFLVYTVMTVFYFKGCFKASEEMEF